METRQDEGRSLGATGLSNQSAWGVMKVGSVWEGLQTERLGNRWRAQCGDFITYDVLRDVQYFGYLNLHRCRQLLGKSRGWYSKTNILRILIT